MIARRLARALGYDLTPRRKLKDLDAQLVFTLERQAIDAVVDVGANRGQYAAPSRAGWRGRSSIEPVPSCTGRWRSAPRGPGVGGGGTGGDRRCFGRGPARGVGRERHELDAAPVGAAADISPSSAVRVRIVVPQRRLGRAPELRQRPWRRLFVKADVQGAERRPRRPRRIWERVHGLQLELALLPLYEGERPWLALVGTSRRGFAPYLLFPGYFARALGRQVQLDMVFYRAAARAAAGCRMMAAPGTFSSGSLPGPPRGLAVRRRLRRCPAGLLWGRCFGWAPRHGLVRLLLPRPGAGRRTTRPDREPGRRDGGDDGRARAAAGAGLGDRPAPSASS